jgi:threonylcarbamoyladenosine tRNA methylthiotransferase MtaB
LPPDEVIRRISRLAATGYREVVLTGIHLGCYGQDADPPTSLAALLLQIEENRSVDRLRLSSIEPLEVTDELLGIFKRTPIICPHLHIPLQSGDDGILALMNRHYDGAIFRSLVAKVMAAKPATALGLDVMVGFPGEDDLAFQRTYDMIEDLPVAYLHVFPFSKRPGTPAAVMKGQVREEDKRERAERLRDLGQEKRRAFMKQFIGQRLQVLIEDRIDKKTGRYKGFSQHYIPVTVDNGRPDLVNTLVTVVAKGIGVGELVGRIVHE